MGTSYPTIAFHQDKCDGCGKCVEACAQVCEGIIAPEHSRIQLFQEPESQKFQVALCRQCAQPRCVAVCPGGALSKDPETGVVRWNEERCVDCRLCTLACPYAGVVWNESKARVMKCELCGGEPACVSSCPHGALELTGASGIHRRWGDLEDLFAPGVSACLGCNSELLVRHTLRRLGPDTILATPPGCIAGVGSVGVNGRTATKIPVFHPLLTNTSAMLAGIKRYYNRIGREVTMLALAGDGGTADVGFQSLSGAAERGEQMIYVCLDNEGYMNTGVQRSSTTPYGAWTSTTPVGTVLKGKTRDAKPLPLLMVMHNCEYVATASLAFMEDYYNKLDKAKEASKRGLAYIHVFSPCPTGWRFNSGNMIEIARKAVETNMFPLWEFDLREGNIVFTHPVDHPLPVEDFLSLIGKYRHLSKDQIAHIHQGTEKRVRILSTFCRSRNEMSPTDAAVGSS